MDDRPLIFSINRTQDASICLLRGSELEWTIQKERLTRQKHHWGRTGDLASIYAARMPGLDQPLDVLVECYSSDAEQGKLAAYEQELAATLRMAPPARRARISHHLAHLYSAFHPSPFSSAAVMIVDDQGGAMVCHQGCRHAGGWWDGPRTTGGYTVLDPGHWVFAGTGLRRGQTFGAGTWPPVVGYECDGAPLASLDLQDGHAVLAPCAAQCGTPAGFAPLAACALDESWQELPAREPQAGKLHAATMGVFTRGGTVFTAGSTDWVQALDCGSDPHLAAITRNVIDHLQRPGTPCH
jgi:hypothetical protein